MPPPLADGRDIGIIIAYVNNGVSRLLTQRTSARTIASSPTSATKHANYRENSIWFCSDARKTTLTCSAASRYIACHRLYRVKLGHRVYAGGVACDILLLTCYLHLQQRNRSGAAYALQQQITSMARRGAATDTKRADGARGAPAGCR